MDETTANLARMRAVFNDGRDLNVTVIEDHTHREVMIAIDNGDAQASVALNPETAATIGASLLDAAAKVRG